MKIVAENWNSLASLFKSQLLAKFDSATLVPPYSDLSKKLNMPHKGFYAIVFDSSNNQLVRVGFLEDGQTNLVDSVSKVVEALYIELQAKNIPYQKLLTGSFNLVAIWDLVFINNGLAWAENEDGVYFSWGDRYNGMYLPIEIQQMTVTKNEIMNRLCVASGIPSTCWRLPEGMCSRILCDSYSIS